MISYICRNKKNSGTLKSDGQAKVQWAAPRAWLFVKSMVLVPTLNADTARTIRSDGSWRVMNPLHHIFYVQ